MTRGYLSVLFLAAQVPFLLLGCGDSSDTVEKSPVGALGGTSGGYAGSNTGGIADTGTDSSTDTDTGTNTGTNTGTKTGTETGTKTGTETGTETDTNTGTNTSTNTGTDTGTGTSGNTLLPKHWHESGGFGTSTKGGLGGEVYRVTTLANSGSGSLRDAVSGTNRLIVFEVGGVIDLAGDRLSIGGNNLTLAGQTAPAPGISVIKADTDISGDDVVVSHMSFRLGDQAGARDTMDIGSNNVVLDHVAASWSVDECVSMGGASNVTFFKTMVTEALSVSVHKEGEHSKGSLIQNGTNQTSFINTLYAFNALRNPRLQHKAQVAAINGVIYGWYPGADDEGSKRFHWVIHMHGGAAMSVVGMTAIQGPESQGEYLVSGHKSGTARAYMKDNLIIDQMGNPLHEYADNVEVLNQPPLWPDAVEVVPPQESLYETLRTVGPRPGDRDPIELRVIKQVADGTGTGINSPSEVGGYPDYPETKHTLVVPEGEAARQAWLDELEDAFAVDRNIDLSRYYGMVGSEADDKLK